MAWRLVREEGTEALTLGRLAEQAGVTKPVVHDHFGTRANLLAALYQGYDLRQTVLMRTALEVSEATLEGCTDIIARAYADCAIQQGREISEVVAVLASSPELEQIKRNYGILLMDECHVVLKPLAGGGQLTVAALCAMISAAEVLLHAAATEGVTPEGARRELYEAIVVMVVWGHR